MLIQGQRYTKTIIDEIKSTIKTEPGISRRKLSRQICRLNDWRSSNGNLKEMSCRKALVELDQRGVIKLPTAEGVENFARAAPLRLEVNLPTVNCTLSELGEVTVKPITSRYTKESKLWRALLEKYHYLGAGPLCGAQVRYIVESAKMCIRDSVWDDPASNGNPLLLDPKVRAAMEYAVDRDKIIEMAYFGYGETGSTLVPSIYDFWHLKLGEEEFRKFDIEKSKQILEEAGYKAGSDGIRVSADGSPLSFTVLIRGESPDGQKAAKLMKEGFKEAGIDLKVETIDEGMLTDKMCIRDRMWGHIFSS